MDCQLLKGNCLEWIPKLPKQSVDFIFCDPPFGSIKEGRLKSIDKVIPPDQMWEAFRHVLKPSGTVVVFGTQPFMSQVIVSNIKQFRYDLIWRKHQSGFLNCNNRPMREHQTIAVFSEKAPGYNPELIFNPQFQNGKAYKRKGSGKKNLSAVLDRPLILDFENDGTRYFPTSVIEPDAPIYNAQMETGRPYIVKRQPVAETNCYAKQNPDTTINNGTRHPSSVLTHKQATSKNHHPFEKPLSLCEWIVRTYTNEGMTILDPTMGGGSSGCAARSLGRKFIGIELDPKWFTVARDRIYNTPIKESVQSRHDQSFGSC
jgi:DNA modification methylase